MFTAMRDGLAAGRMPETVEIAARLKLAIVKKMGVLKLPPSFWQQDPKINPPVRDLFWAATLIGDEHLLADVIGLATVEHEASPSGRNLDLGAELSRWLDELAALVGPEGDRRIESCRAMIPISLAPGPCA